jgi:proteasome accessory factor A
MRDRVFSLETEYAITFQSSSRNSLKNLNREIFEALRQTLVERYGISDSSFLINGSKFYYDAVRRSEESTGNIEWSLPECRTARETVIYDNAADRALAQAIPAAEQHLQQQGFAGRLFLIKNNVDSHGNTYGCHENYQAERITHWLSAQEHLRMTIRYLVPFLVTRQIFCGSGRVGWGKTSEQGVRFQIMQRADFIEAVVSKETVQERAIVNLSRESESLMADNQQHRRLHLILADSNMSGWATYLKLGTMGIMLCLLEELGFGEIPHLQNPLQALRQISRDPSCTVQVQLSDGSTATAIEIQRLYLNQAEAYFQTHTASSEERDILRDWKTILDQLEQDPMQLSDRLDWVAKKRLMDLYLQRQGQDWQNIPENKEVHYKLLELDIQYHNLSPQISLFHKLLVDKPTLATVAEIEQAQIQPPPHTRAWLRGTAIALARTSKIKVAIDFWDKLKIDQCSIAIPDPLEFYSPQLCTLVAARTQISPLAAPTDADRSQHQIIIYTSNLIVGERLADALIQLGYQSVRVREQDAGTLRCQWNSVDSWMMTEVSHVLHREMGVLATQFEPEFSPELSSGSISIHLPS